MVLALLHSESQKKQKQNGYFLCMKEKRNYLECFFYFFFLFCHLPKCKQNKQRQQQQQLPLTAWVRTIINKQPKANLSIFISFTHHKISFKNLVFSYKKFFFSHLVFLLSLFSFFDLRSPIQLSFIMRGMCQRLY